MSLTHFVCTLDKAEEINEGVEFSKTINGFIAHQTNTVPEYPAVGFAYPLDYNASGVGAGAVNGASNLKRNLIKHYTFKQVQQGVAYVRQQINKTTHTASRGETVALLCPSTPEFLFTWLALIASGYQVLLVAPQLPSSAISHLCDTCQVKTLYHDRLFESKAAESVEVSTEQNKTLSDALLIPFSTNEDEFKRAIEDIKVSSIPSTNHTKDDIAFIFHSSGTSSGMPKPIPQSHNGAIGVLPRLNESFDKATYSTTPLYHGGVADLFRCWSSDAMMWLFPGKDYTDSKELQLTSSNVLSSLQIATASKLRSIAYFSSVPWILQMLVENSDGLQILRRMDMVGIGGAALAAEEGGKLVNEGINLVSRYGSAECGFLLSSHRDYANDHAWDYLRADPKYSRYKFEPHGEGKFELVIRPSWPHRAKTNCDDGSFKTADLFTPHTAIENAWKYDSRADSQLTLVTGKKFDPAPMEGSLASLEVLEDAFIFGEGKPYPGAIVFRSETSTDVSEDEFLKVVGDHLDKINSQSQRHAQISKHMLVPMTHSQNKLPKSSKGTLLRNKAQDIYADTINNTYGSLDRNLSHITDDEVLLLVRSIVQRLLNQELETDESILNHGVDSIILTQIRLQLHRLLPIGSQKLPMTILEKYDTIDRIADYIIKRRNGEQTLEEKEESVEVMNSVVQQYADFSSACKSKDATSSGSVVTANSSRTETILLTGATGMLGAQMLDMYRKDENTRKIYCLVRETPNSSLTPLERVSEALSSRGLESLSVSSGQTDEKVEVLACKFSEPGLGLQSDVYHNLLSEVTTLMHAAWAVNFRLGLRSYVKEYIAGTRHLIDLVTAALNSTSRTTQLTPSFAFCSSVASVSNSPGHPIPEQISSDPSDAAKLGYGQSKWIAETLCANASNSGAVPDMAVFRVGQLSGDTRTGAWNMSEAYPLMLSSAKATGCLPDLGKSEKLQWLPVDTAAACLVQGSKGLRGKGLSVYHVLNDASPASSWSDLLKWVGKREKYEVVAPRTWIEKMYKLQDSDPSHPALGLLEHWSERVGEGKSSGKKGESESREVSEEARFDTSISKRDIQVLAKDVKPVDEEYFENCLAWIKRQG